MANSYIPRAQAQALGWMQTFAGGISANPSVYQLMPADAAAIHNAVDAFADALAVSSSEATGTKVTVNLKDTTRNAAEQICQQYYSLIKPNAGISDADKIAIGVRPINRGRTAIQVPQTSPALNVVACTPGVHTLRYKDSLTPTSSGKPFGAAFLELRVAVADEPVQNVDQAKPAGLYTRIRSAFRSIIRTPVSARRIGDRGFRVAANSGRGRIRWG